MHYVYNSTFMYSHQIEELQALVNDKILNSESDNSKNVGRRFSPGIISCNIKEKDALTYTSLAASADTSSLTMFGRVMLKIKIDRVGASYKNQNKEIMKCQSSCMHLNQDVSLIPEEQ